MLFFCVSVVVLLYLVMCRPAPQKIFHNTRWNSLFKTLSNRHFSLLHRGNFAISLSKALSDRHSRRCQLIHQNLHSVYVVSLALVSRLRRPSVIHSGRRCIKCIAFACVNVAHFANSAPCYLIKLSQLNRESIILSQKSIKLNC